MSYFDRMRQRVSVLASAAALIAMTFLAGCSEERPITSPSTMPAQADSASHALSQARDGYESYLRLTVANSTKGEEGLVDLQPFLTAEALSRERSSLERTQEKRLRLSGVISLRKFVLQQFDKGNSVLVAYACVDFTKTRVKDAAGRDITPASRENLQTTAPRFLLEAGRWKLEEDAEWSGKSVC